MHSIYESVISEIVISNCIYFKSLINVFAIWYTAKEIHYYHLLKYHIFFKLLSFIYCNDFFKFKLNLLLNDKL